MLQSGGKMRVAVERSAGGTGVGEDGDVDDV
jgi:hypothetical protein